MVWIRFGGLRFSGISSKLIHPVGFGGGVWSGGVGWARGGRGGGGGDGDIVLLSEDSDRDGLRYSRGLCRPTVTQLFYIARNFKLVISPHIKACLRTRSKLGVHETLAANSPVTYAGGPVFNPMAKVGYPH